MKFQIVALGMMWEVDEVDMNDKGELVFDTTSKEGTFRQTVKANEYVIQERIGDAPKIASLSIVGGLPPTK